TGSGAIRGMTWPNPFGKRHSLGREPEEMSTDRVGRSRWEPPPGNPSSRRLPLQMAARISVVLGEANRVTENGEPRTENERRAEVSSFSVLGSSSEFLFDITTRGWSPG